MAQFHDSDWWSSELKRLLKVQEPENLHLDYKDKRSLLSPQKGDSISKQVSSFLNSDGGVLIYGVPEGQGSTATRGAPVPITQSGLIGFQPGEIDKETIENLITSNVQPRPGPELFQIAEVTYKGRTVFIIEIAVGLGNVWQAKDKRYYKRFNYKAEPMEHYEINMVRDRNTGPDLRLVFGLDGNWEKVKDIHNNINDRRNTIYLGIQNVASSAAEAVLIELGISEGGRAPSADGRSDRILPSLFRHTGHRTVRDDDKDIEVDWYDLRWPTDSVYRPIFGTVAPMYVSEFPFRIENSPPHVFDGQGREFPYLKRWFFWQVQAPNMSPKRGKTAIVRVRNGFAISLEEEDGDFEILDEA